MLCRDTALLYWLPLRPPPVPSRTPPHLEVNCTSSAVCARARERVRCGPLKRSYEQNLCM